jgi:hypothetical protein
MTKDAEPMKSASYKEELSQAQGTGGGA